MTFNLGIVAMADLTVHVFVQQCEQETVYSK